MFTVVITEKDGPERRITFLESEVTVGRVPGNDVVLPKGNVSKRHSRIVFKDNRFIVVDLKSTNGTYVNGRKITSPLVVKEGDKIYVGDYILTLESTPGLDELRPPSLQSGPSELGGSAPMVLSLSDPMPTSADESDGDDELPPVLRPVGPVSTSIPMSGASLSGSAAHSLADDDDAIVAAESELEPLDEERASGVPEPHVFPPPIEPHRRERIPRALPLRPTQETAAHTLLGPIDAVLDDPAVFHVVVERHDRVRADRGQGLVLEPTSFSSPEALVRVTQQVLSELGLPPFTPSFDVSLTSGLHVVALQAGAASQGPVLSVRRRPTRVPSLADLTESERMSAAVRGALEEALQQHRHVWVAGPSGCDLAGLLSALLAACAAEDRVALFERAPEVALGERAAIGLKLGVVGLGELLERVQQLRPDRLVMHGLREDELAVALDAFAHRQDGSAASLTARSAKDALAVIDRVAGADVALRAVSLLVEAKRGDDGKTRVSAAYHVELDGSGDLSLKPVG